MERSPPLIGFLFMSFFYLYSFFIFLFSFFLFFIFFYLISLILKIKYPQKQDRFLF